jgi:hypothetical protein
MRTAETVLNIRRETALPFRVEITGERRDTETVMRRSEGGDWKSASKVTRWSPTLPHVRI